MRKAVPLAALVRRGATATQVHALNVLKAMSAWDVESKRATPASTRIPKEIPLAIHAQRGTSAPGRAQRIRRRVVLEPIRRALAKQRVATALLVPSVAPAQARSLRPTAPPEPTRALQERLALLFVSRALPVLTARAQGRCRHSRAPLASTQVKVLRPARTAPRAPLLSLHL